MSSQLGFGGKRGSMTALYKNLFRIRIKLKANHYEKSNQFNRFFGNSYGFGKLPKKEQ